MRAGLGLLAIALAGCSAPVKPVARAAAAERENHAIPEDDDYDPPGDEDYETGRGMTAADRVARLRHAIEDEDATLCGHRASGRFGEVRVQLRPASATEPIVGVTTGPGVSEESRACVAESVRGQVSESGLIGRDLDKELTFYVLLGTPPPLLPPIAELRPRWEAALRSPAARQRFEAKLPAEVTLAPDGCLSIPIRRRFSQALDRWRAGVGTPLAEFWQNEALASEPTGAKPLLSDLGPVGTQHWRGTWLGDAFLLERQGPWGGPTVALCLEPLADARARELRSRVDRLGTCWSGDLAEILTRPRTVFPTNRPFAGVAVRPERVCALDGAGLPVCCGARLSADPPPVPFTQLALGRDVDCGLTADGALRCWGTDPPGGGAPIAGPFDSVTVGLGGDREVCTVRRTDHWVTCWQGTKKAPPPIPLGTRALAGFQGGLCALQLDGRILCQGSRDLQLPRGLPGRFRALAASPAAICAIDALAGREVRCWWGWDAWPDWSPAARVQVPLRLAPEPWTELAVGGDQDGCALGRSGRITCWPPGRNGNGAFGGVYRALAGSGRRRCAVTVDGRVECNRGWPEP